ncbi:hypothetical protein CJP46_18220 [Paenibacillus sp. XY044]|nr:hypothetical protein CJP46_18220 [Paenibacillus sp. XY044]
MIQVAAAKIENEHWQMLIARKKVGKPPAGLWELSGGKRKVYRLVRTRKNNTLYLSRFYTKRVIGIPISLFAM